MGLEKTCVILFPIRADQNRNYDQQKHNQQSPKFQRAVTVPCVVHDSPRNEFQYQSGIDVIIEKIRVCHALTFGK